MSDFDYDLPDSSVASQQHDPNAHINDFGRNLLQTFDEAEPTDSYSEEVNQEDLSEQRRIAALNIAQHVSHSTVEDLLVDAALVDTFLKTGNVPSVNPVRSDLLSEAGDQGALRLPQNGGTEPLSADPGVTGEGQA